MKMEFGEHKAGLELGLAIFALWHPEAAVAMPMYNYVASLFKKNKSLNKEYSKNIVLCIKKALSKTKDDVTSNSKIRLVEYAEQYTDKLNKEKALSGCSTEDIQKYLHKLFHHITDNSEVYANASDILFLADTFKRFFEEGIIKLDKTCHQLLINSIDALNEDVKSLKEQLKKSVKEKRLPDFVLYNQIEQNISFRKESVSNQSLFPWIYGKIYKDAFPKLFIIPKFKTDKGEASFEDVIKFSRKNIAIIGAPGSGKSTFLRFIFAFDKLPNTKALYITANELIQLSDTVLEKINSLEINQEYLILIDGIDEAFYNNYKAYEQFINTLKNTRNCHFWIGCREDFYSSHHSEKTSIFENAYCINPWTAGQADTFIKEYGNLISDEAISTRTEKLVSRSELLEQIKHNPFQLSILAYIAETDTKKSINNIFDLYENFVAKWMDNEIKRGTSTANIEEIILELRSAAKAIYQGKSWELTKLSNENSAIRNILTDFSEQDMYGKICAGAFYHRSIAAFLLAESAVQAICNKQFSSLQEIFLIVFKDDVTNFIIDKLSTFSNEEKIDIKNTMINLYNNCNGCTRIQEQCIYYATRLGIDASDFLCEIIEDDPEDPLIRLSLAYGCVLSDNAKARRFALKYAKSIARGGIDAITNRAWTVIYFGDVVRDPYTYKDDEKSSWQNARNARLTRFTKENPRKKDYRFRLFDIPLFFSYLVDRDWDNISSEEFEILNNVEFPPEHFNSEERKFLSKQKGELIAKYKQNLNALHKSKGD